MKLLQKVRHHVFFWDTVYKNSGPFATITRWQVLTFAFVFQIVKRRKTLSFWNPDHDHVYAYNKHLVNCLCT